MIPKLNPEFHQEDHLTKKLEGTRRITRDAKERIFHLLRHAIGQAKHGIRIPESIEELEKEINDTARTLEILQYDETEILGRIAHKDNIIKDTER